VDRASCASVRLILYQSSSSYSNSQSCEAVFRASVCGYLL